MKEKTLDEAWIELRDLLLKPFEPAAKLLIKIVLKIEKWRSKNE